MLRHLRHWCSGDLLQDCPSCFKHIEPWMFGVTVMIDGREVQAQVRRFSLLGRTRMAARRLAGRPERVPMPDMDEG